MTTYDPSGCPCHVHPLYEPGHILEGVGCWCLPHVEHVDPATGERYTSPLVVHRDAKQRAAEAS